TVYLLLIIGAFLLPSETIGSFMTPESDWASVLFYPIGIYVLLAIGLNVVVGQAGLLDLGYVAFFAIGAYALAVFATKRGWSFWEIVPAGIIIAAAAGAASRRSRTRRRSRTSRWAGSRSCATACSTPGPTTTCCWSRSSW